MTTPVIRTPARLGNTPSMREAKGLLPAQATAHSPMT